jgi:hypothetical protein
MGEVMKRSRRTSTRTAAWALAAGLPLGLVAAPREAHSYYSAISGSRTGACIALPDNQILDCWLKAHPNVAAQIGWYFPGLPYPQNLPSYKDWPAWLKQDLNTEWDLAMKYYSWQIPGPLSRFPEPLPKGVYDPSANPAYTTIDPTTAERVYLSFVANTLATEMVYAFGWSITAYSTDELAELLNYNKLLQYSGNGAYAGWYRTTGMSPMNATALVRFFWNEVGPTDDPLQAASRMIEWSNRLAHVFSAPPESGWPPESDFYGPDAPPGTYAQMIEGSPYQGPDLSLQGWTEHWTFGCGGTTDFLIHVMKAINMPVKHVYDGSVPQCLHNSPYFMTIDRYLSHGDDPYDQLVKNDPQIPGDQILIPGWEFAAWFPPKAQDPNGLICSANVGRQDIELALWYLTDGLLEMYCDDVVSKTPRKQGEVFQALSSVYSYQDLLKMKLWNKLSVKAKQKKLKHCKPGKY